MVGSVLTLAGVALAGLALALEVVLRLRRDADGDGEADEPNAYVRELRASTWRGSRYVDTLFPHPYVGWVHHGDAPDGVRGVNNVGLFGADFPLERDPSRFVVLLTGGSVASQVGQVAPEGPRYLEEELNRRWATDDGRRFVVLNGAAGAWKQPQQAILFLLHCDAVDAVVTLDGWNEHYALTSSSRLEAPASNFHLTNPVATGTHRQLLGVWLAGLVDAAGRRPVLRRSRAARLLAAALRRALYRALVERGRGRRTTVESLFALPAHWTPADVFRHAVRSYAKYIVSMNAVARQWGVRTAHFIQPAPAIGKELTAAERAVVGDLSYRDRYLAMVEELMRLARLGIPVVSLLDAFAGCRETLYADWTHLARDPQTGESPGYRLLAARMADELAAAWGLTPRTAAEAPPAPSAVVVAVPTHAGTREETLATTLAAAGGGPGVEVCVRAGTTAGASAMHLIGTSAYRVVAAHAAQALAGGVPYVLTAFLEDWARWRVASEALAERYRTRLGLPPGVTADEYARTVERECAERREVVAAAVHGARLVVATGASEARRLAREFPGVAPVVLPVPLPERGGGDVDRFVATYGTRDFVLCVGRLEPRKNQLALLEALADDPVDVVLATGGVAHRPDYLEACRALRRRGRTLYLPRLTDDELAAAFRAARVHVLPGWESLPGLATLEAVRAGCAVVAGAGGTLGDLLGDLVPTAPPDDPGALRTAIAAAGGWSFAAARARVEELAPARAAVAWRTAWHAVTAPADRDAA